MTRLALLILVAALPSVVAVASASEQTKDPSFRTGGMGVGTRPTGAVERPGTDMTTAGSGAGEGKPGATAGADRSSGKKATRPR